MSSSITIPTRTSYGESSKAGAGSSSSSSSYSSSPQTPQQPQEKSTISSPNARYGHDRRRSLLSSSFSKQEHTVINIGILRGFLVWLLVSDHLKDTSGIQKSSFPLTSNATSNHSSESETPSTRYALAMRRSRRCFLNNLGSYRSTRG